jgi:hypothetical protein
MTTGRVKTFYTLTAPPRKTSVSVRKKSGRVEEHQLPSRSSEAKNLQPVITRTRTPLLGARNQSTLINQKIRN